jgi:septal ring factor EnvC (AmiA/AmiB activator)
MIVKYFILIILIVSPVRLWCQDYKEEKSEQEKRLQELRSEISAVEKQISQTSTQKEALDDQLSLLEHKLSLRKRAIFELKKDIGTNERDLGKTQNRLSELQVELVQIEGDISTLTKEITALETIVTKRAVHAYKHWIWNELQSILSAEDFNQAFTRKRYFQAVAERDIKNVQQLKTKLEELRQLRLQELSLQATTISVEQELKDGLQYKRELSDEVESEQKSLLKEKKNKLQILSKIKYNQSLLFKELAQKRKAADRVEAIIADLIAKAKSSPVEVDLPSGSTFSGLKGRMNWPAEGRIISRFGKQINPQLKTWTENTGIDIKSAPGAEVQAVAEGKVTYITWLRGFGTTLIIGHQDGYYTVYTHLDEVYCNPGSKVTQGQIIGTLSSEDTGAQGVLHFEIWEKKNKQDPEKWLKPKG